MAPQWYIQKTAGELSRLQPRVPAPQVRPFWLRPKYVNNISTLDLCCLPLIAVRSVSYCTTVTLTACTTMLSRFQICSNHILKKPVCVPSSERGWTKLWSLCPVMRPLSQHNKQAQFDEYPRCHSQAYHQKVSDNIILGPPSLLIFTKAVHVPPLILLSLLGINDEGLHELGDCEYGPRSILE
ncbi:hypothetical protein SeMB42_g03836 [Synchytrium endobioticum]|uniref:Uncharacterized protein n=1 Tax=Synchytrium endobioticum TaxID=286115 RepID=A0A507D3W4_9FUNG|nr:hypothetical protein SeMB42_g03836 [Synchytrium endobioticum]